jgi:cytochrome oxidase assembly protein ShyY1
VRRLNVKGQIRPKQKHNVEVKIKCVMQNEWINALTTNHSRAPLLEQKQMQVLDVEEMESSSNLNPKDVLC